MCFACPWWADKDNILTVVDKAKVQQAVDLLLADGGLEAEKEFYQGLEQEKYGAFSVLLNA